MVISELENHMTAVAGLFPTWDLPTDQHLSGARAAISKLAMGTYFGQAVLNHVLWSGSLEH